MSAPHARRIAVSRFSDRAIEVSASVTTHSPWSNSIMHGSPPTSTSQRLPLSRSCSFADMTIIIENALLARRRTAQAAEREKGRKAPGQAGSRLTPFRHKSALFLAQPSHFSSADSGLRGSSRPAEVALNAPIADSELVRDGLRHE